MIEKTNLIITVDTEGDNAWNNCAGESKTENASYIPQFQQLCESFGFKPTYLTSYEMTKDSFFVEYISDCLKRGTCEVGLHPHPWNMPPEYLLTSNDSLYKPYMIEYPEHIMREKIKILHDLLCEKFNRRIISHRAGRWAFNATYAKILVELGYKVDCSVTPHISGILTRPKDNEPCKIELPDYSKFPDKPYFLSENDISQEGDLPILELPMTIVPNYGRLRNFIYNRIAFNAGKLVFRFLFGRSVLWFRPSRHHPCDWHTAAKKRISQHADYIMFMIHSSELMPGCNPNFRNKAEVDALYADMEEVFIWLHTQEVVCKSCFEFYEKVVSVK